MDHSTVAATRASASESISCRPAAGLSCRLAEFACSFDSRHLPPSAAHAAKRAILDGIGVMLAASGECSEVRPFLAWATSQAGAKQAPALGFGVRLSAAHAALVNGAMAHALDYEDAFDPVPLHPNASLLPAALAMLALHPCSGGEFLCAVALGCDLVCRLGLALRRPLEAGGWYPPPILGAFGATLAAARLARLAALQLCDAWSLVLAQNSCPGEIRFSRDGALRGVREAFPAHAAVQAVQLAGLGVRGFEAPFEGPAAFYQLFAQGQYDLAPLLDRLGEFFWIERLSFKPWPCCRGTHAYIEAAQRLRREQPFSAADIDRIVCVGGSVQEMLAVPPERKRAPRTPIEAKFSLPFTVAVALTQSEVTLVSFAPHALSDPDLLELAAKCEFERHPAWGPEHAASGRLVLILRDGRTLQHEILGALGEPGRTLDDAALCRKFVDCAARAARPLSRARAARLAERVLSLECEPDAAVALGVGKSR